VNARRSIPSLVLLAATCAWPGAGTALAAESREAAAPEKKEESPRGQEDSIAAARRDFEAVKSMRELPAPTRNAGVPRLVMPEFSVGNTPSTPAARTKRPELDGQRSNWLVDAVTKRPTPQAGRRDERTNPRQEEDLPAESGSKSEPEDPGATRKDLTRTANPFAPYLEGWMTPQDYALLNPGTNQLLADTVFGPRGLPTPAQGELLSPRPASGAEMFPSGHTRSRALGTTVPARENPYLEALGGQAPGGTARPVAPDRAAPTVTPVAPAAEALPPPNHPKSRVPDFVRPSPVDKNFKQFKRF
jgi:hypothetical protein